MEPGMTFSAQSSFKGEETPNYYKQMPDILCAAVFSAFNGIFTLKETKSDTDK